MAAAAAVAPPPMAASQQLMPKSSLSPNFRPGADLKAAAMTATQRTTGINTPISASFPPTSAFPSSLQSPRVDSPHSASFRSTSGSSKGATPLTPPTAYLDFLKILTPTFSPMSSSASSHFTFGGVPHSARMAPPGSAALDPKEQRFSLPSHPNSARPALPSQSSSSSIRSNNSDKSNSVGVTSTKSAPEPLSSKRPTDAIDSPTYPYPQGPSRTNSFSSVPPSPRHPERPSRRPSLRIPDSPSTASPTLVRSPGHVRSPTHGKPHIQSPLSAVPYSAGGKTSPVAIRHVVTRTVVYSSSPVTSIPPGIDSRLARQQPLVGEAPKGKRRKLERDQE